MSAMDSYQSKMLEQIFCTVNILIHQDTCKTNKEKIHAYKIKRTIPNNTESHLLKKVV